MGAVKNDNYVTIQGWMINELQLTGNELMAYAVIYGFSQADGQYMSCSQEYIAAWLNISREATNRLLKRLIANGLVEKREGRRKGAVVIWQYKAIRPEDRKKEEPQDKPKQERKSKLIANPGKKTAAKIKAKLVAAEQEEKAVPAETPKAEPETRLPGNPNAEPEKETNLAAVLETIMPSKSQRAAPKKVTSWLDNFMHRDYDVDLIEEILLFTG